MIIDSKKGVGTKVKLYFDFPEKLPGRVITAQKLINPKDKSILLAEDNPVSIKVTTAILKKAGFNVKHVENGKEVLEILDKERFDLILMDGQMPIMDGYEAAKAIREGKCFQKFKQFKTIPIIALTANSYDEIINQVKESGMDAHIDKSSSIKDWLDLIVNYLDK